MEWEKKKIIIADDHAVVRTGMQMILESTPDLEIIDEAISGDELLEKLEEKTSDMVILDISIPGRDSLDVLKTIKEKWPLIAVVIFTMDSDDVYAVRMIRAGASAYINNQTRPPQIIEILRTVAGGKKYFTMMQSELIAEALSKPYRKDGLLHDLLTDREFQIMFMLASGLKKSEIAAKLQLSKNTIGNHRNNILKKMNLTSNSELTRYAIKNGIIK